MGISRLRHAYGLSFTAQTSIEVGAGCFVAGILLEKDEARRKRLEGSLRNYDFILGNLKK